MGSQVADLVIGVSWEDVVATHASAASVDVRIQNVGKGEVSVVQGGGAEPTNTSGTLLGPRDSVEVNAANLWVRGDAAGRRISVTLV